MATPSATEQLRAALSSTDAATRNAGVEQALALGAAAVPALLQLLVDEPAARAPAMYALAQLADARAQAAFEAALADADEAVRAHAAVGLARSGHPRALPALLQTLDDAPDWLHLDRTPAVDALAAIGLPAAPPLLALMDGAESTTRLHAQRAFEGIVALHGGAAAPAIDYRHDAPPGDRAAAVQRWRDWLAAQRS